MQNVEHYVNQLYSLLAAYLPKLAGAIVVLLVGLFVIARLVSASQSIMSKKEVDKSLIPFVCTLTKFLLTAILVVSVAGMVGIATSSFVAILGAAGLAVGLALQGSLSNFAGGVLLLVLKPIKHGEFIEAQGVSGTVDAISIFATQIVTPDNKVITIPNGPLANGNIINYSRKETRRVDFVFGVGYTDDLDKVKATIKSVLSEESRIINEPAEPLVVVSQLADSSVNFTVRLWTKTSDYWPVNFDITEKMKKRFDKEGISIPFPQRDVHMIKD